MALRNQITRQQLANSTAFHALGYGDSGVPSLMSLVNLEPNGQLRMFQGSNYQNRMELMDWSGGFSLTGLAGSWQLGPDQIVANQIQTYQVFITGLASDESEAYSSCLMATFYRASSGDESLLGTVEKIFEQKSQVGATSDIAGNSGGAIVISYDSGQLVLQYTWSIRVVLVTQLSAFV